MPEGERTLIASNRRARHDYEIVDTLEAGIALLGPEVKSLRAGRANIGDAYASIRKGEMFLQSLHISPYEPARLDNAEPLRERKLLVHRRQIERLKNSCAGARLYADSAESLFQRRPRQGRVGSGSGQAPL